MQINDYETSFLTFDFYTVLFTDFHVKLVNQTTWFAEKTSLTGTGVEPM